MVVAVAIGTVALLAIVVAAAVGLGNDVGQGSWAGHASDTSARVDQAAQHLATVAGLRYSGSFSSGGATIGAQISVTKTGSASGSLTVDGDRAELIAVDGSTYLKANRSFWRSHGGVTSNPEDYAGRWSRVAPSTLDLDLKETLAPGALISRLRAARSRPTLGVQDINGTRVVKITTLDGDLYVTTSGRATVVRVESTGTSTYRFDTTELSAGKVTTLLAQLRTTVSRLTGAPDPGVHFLPNGSLKFSNCGADGCTVKYSVTSVSLNGGSPVRAVLRATIQANGKVLGSCTDTRTVGSAKTVDLSCTVTGSGWSSWVRWARRTPGTHRYEAKARVIAEAVSPSEVARLLSKIDQELQGLS